jgi:hypothetical protein
MLERDEQKGASAAQVARVRAPKLEAQRERAQTRSREEQGSIGQGKSFA